MFESSELDLFIYITHKGKLLCYLDSKDDAGIQQELPIVLSLFENNRRRIQEEQDRNHFFDTEQGVYDLAIDYEYERGNIEESFNYADTSRARSLLAEVAAVATADNKSALTGATAIAASQPLTFSQVKERMPYGLKLIEYAVLQNRLLIWIITEGGIEAIERPVTASSLERAVDEYLSVLPRSDGDSIKREREQAAQLYDWLFAPLKDYLNDGEVVAIVPDKFLFKIPFAALLSSCTDQRVINDHTLLYAPSATVLILYSELGRNKGQDKQKERLLSVGDPKFSRRRHRDLPYLPAAADEARKIASFYLDSCVLVDEEAVKNRIKDKLPWANIIHFATHYIADGISSAKSRLVLAAGAGVDDLSADLTIEEVQSWRLPDAKLVVLAACRSGIERYYAGEGLIGLARSFVMAGAPLVVASQWAVESESTAQLMIDFHHLRKQGDMPTARALRQAQLNMLNHDNEIYHRPYYWAGFFPIGGYASY
jgi:CHAT domain-containing protein